MDAIAFLVITLLLLAFQPTRFYGVIGLCLLSLAHPFFLLAVLILSGITYYLYIRYQRRQHELSRLPERRP